MRSAVGWERSVHLSKHFDQSICTVTGRVANVLKNRNSYISSTANLNTSPTRRKADLTSATLH